MDVYKSGYLQGRPQLLIAVRKRRSGKLAGQWDAHVARLNVVVARCALPPSETALTTRADKLLVARG